MSQEELDLSDMDDFEVIEERRQVQMIVCVTPEEGTGYLAGVK